MSAIRFLLDENVAPFYRRELLRRDPALVIWKVGDISAPRKERLTLTYWFGAKRTALSW